MGAMSFSAVAHGVNARAAFDAAVESAKWECGNGGYTGTIAEKDDFVMIHPDDQTLSDLQADEYMPCDDGPLWRRVNDKWGPAGCIDLKDGRYLFYGWASC